jgi:membrane fusion protein (multidrug efflux system)
LASPRRLAAGIPAVGDNDRTTTDPGPASFRARRPVPQERLHSERRVDDFPLGHKRQRPEHSRKTEGELRRRLRRQDALVAAIALLLLAVAALAMTFLYWDYGRPFESTDDAFVAGRQFPMVAQATATR